LNRRDNQFFSGCLDLERLIDVCEVALRQQLEHCDWPRLYRQ